MQPWNGADLTKFTGDDADGRGDTLGEIECRRRKILTLMDLGVDLENNQDRICCQTSQPSKFEETRGTFWYKKQD